MLMTAGADVGPAKYPIAKPIAEKGSEPATRVNTSFVAVAACRCTPPKSSPNINSSSTSAVLKIMLMTTLAKKYADGGIGLARFNCSHPNPRSDAKVAAVPNSDAPMTPNVPYAGIKYKVLL